MIPEKIHYCWFGKGELPPVEQKCIESWRKYCPDYEIIRWDESNYDVTSCLYMKQAYEMGKWGFVPDYARLDIICQHGGIYLDTDVELLRNLDPLLVNSAFIGREKGGLINPGGGFGAEPGHPFIKKNRDIYLEMDFIRQDGSLNMTSSPRYTTDLLAEKGLCDDDKLQNIDGITVYPTAYFAPIDYRTGIGKADKNTFSVHHYSASWLNENEKRKLLQIRKIYQKYGLHIGNIVCKSSTLCTLISQRKWASLWLKIKRFYWFR